MKGCKDKKAQGYFTESRDENFKGNNQGISKLTFARQPLSESTLVNSLPKSKHEERKRIFDCPLDKTGAFDDLDIEVELSHSKDYISTSLKAPGNFAHTTGLSMNPNVITKDEEKPKSLKQPIREAIERDERLERKRDIYSFVGKHKRVALISGELRNKGCAACER